MRNRFDQLVRGLAGHVLGEQEASTMFGPLTKQDMQVVPSILREVRGLLWSAGLCVVVLASSTLESATRTNLGPAPLIRHDRGVKLEIDEHYGRIDTGVHPAPTLHAPRTLRLSSSLQPFSRSLLDVHLAAYGAAAVQ